MFATGQRVRWTFGRVSYIGEVLSSHQGVWTTHYDVREDVAIFDGREFPSTSDVSLRTVHTLRQSELTAAPVLV